MSLLPLARWENAYTPLPTSRGRPYRDTEHRKESSMNENRCKSGSIIGKILGVLVAFVYLVILITLMYVLGVGAYAMAFDGVPSGNAEIMVALLIGFGLMSVLAILLNIENIVRKARLRKQLETFLDEVSKKAEAQDAKS